MKKLLSLIISLALIISVTTTAFATNSNEENLYIPSPDEIQELYNHLTAARATEETLLEYILSDNSDISDQPLLQLGVLSSFAETQNDLSILITASSLVTEVLGDSTNWNCSTVSGLKAHSGLPKAQSKAFDCSY